MTRVPAGEPFCSTCVSCQLSQKIIQSDIAISRFLTFSVQVAPWFPVRPVRPSRGNEARQSISSARKSPIRQLVTCPPIPSRRPTKSPVLYKTHSYCLPDSYIHCQKRTAASALSGCHSTDIGKRLESCSSTHHRIEPARHPVSLASRLRSDFNLLPLHP